MTARDPNDYPRDHKPGTHWATALAAIALITATGMSHAAPPPDVVTGAGIKPLALFYPPKEFDHPYAGTLIITPAVNIEEVHRYCLPTPAALGCARIGRDTCEVIVAPEIQLKAFGWTTADVIRHETAHCNGWPGDHRGRITAAAGAEVPAQYRGLWCDDSKGYYHRCRKATSEGYLHVRRDRINLSEEGDCRITAVTPSAKGHRLRVNCPPEVLPDPPEHVNLRLDAGGRLHFASTEAEVSRWEYDWRRCIVSRNVGNFGFRFMVDYSPPYIIDFAAAKTKDDLPDPDFKVGSVWLGRASWVPDDGKLGSRAEVLPHLRQGNTLVVYSTDGDSVLRWQIEGGDKAAKFLIDCPRYWESGLWERRHRKHR